MGGRPIAGRFAPLNVPPETPRSNHACTSHPIDTRQRSLGFQAAPSSLSNTGTTRIRLADCPPVKPPVTDTSVVMLFLPTKSAAPALANSDNVRHSPGHTRPVSEAYGPTPNQLTRKMPSLSTPPPADTVES